MLNYSVQNHIWIDPENCGSEIGYHIHVEEYEPKDKPPQYSLQASVVLSDCTRKIDWAFCNDQLDKIDKAIEMLVEFRKKYLEAERLVTKLNK
jgi:hypothetical protein